MRFHRIRFTVGGFVTAIGLASIIAFGLGVLLDAPSWLLVVLFSVPLLWLVVSRLVDIDPLSKGRRRSYGEVFKSADFRPKPFEAPFGDEANDDDRRKG